MLSLFADIGQLTSHHIGEIAMLLCLIGGLLLAGGGALPHQQRWLLIAGGLVLAVGFAVFIVVMHWGESPFWLD
jgi:hypothetical protein